MQASTRGRAQPPSRALVLAIALLAAVLALAGCQSLRSMSPQARRDAATAAALLQLQQQNMRFADNYVMRLVEAVRTAELRAADPMQRYHLSGWMLAQAVTAYSAASGDNAVMGALDLVALATLSRAVIEVSGPRRFPDQVGPVLAVHRELETEAWALAADFLTPAQQAELRRVLLDWRAQHMDVETAPFVRFAEFVSVMPSTASQSSTASHTSLMGLVGLDPMAGLDPAVRQVEQSRLLAERAIYYAQRVPIIVDLQLDRSLNRIAVDPDTRALLAQTASMSTSAERFAAVAEALPDEFSKEREALIRQLTELLTTQQATLLPMLVELRGALEAGNLTATSVDGAVRSIDTLVARFKTPPGAGTSPGRPFDITEYTQAADGITRTAVELRQLIGSIDAQAPQLSGTLAASVAKGQSLVDYFFVRVAWLIALLCVGLLATLLAYRWLAPRVRAS
jgi:hypothetical protein